MSVNILYSFRDAYSLVSFKNRDFFHPEDQFLLNVFVRKLECCCEKQELIYRKQIARQLHKL